MATDPEPDAVSPGDSPTSETPAAEERWPIGFMLTIAMVALYVGFRLVQLGMRLFQWLF